MLAPIVIVLFVWLVLIQIRVLEQEKELDNITRRLDFANKRLLKLLSGNKVLTQEEQSSQPVTNAFDEQYEYDETDEFYNEEDYTEDDDEFIEKNEYRKQNNLTTKNRHTRVYNNTKSNKNSIESFFLGNAFTIIGAIALIIGVGIFIKLISPFFIFTPLMKTIIGFVFGLGLIATSHAIKKENLKSYSEVLMGTGFSVLFITTLCTTVLFKTFSTSVCSIIAAIILVMAYLAADKQKTVSMIAIALIGGYLNIAFASHMEINTAFGYIIFLNLLSLIYVFRNPKMELVNIVNLIITLLLTIIISHGRFDEIHIACPIILWLIYFIYDLINTNKIQNINKPNVLNWANLSVLTMFSLLIFEKEKLYIGATLVCVAIVYNIVVGYLMMKGSEKFKPYLYSLLVTIILCVYFLAEDITRIALWSVIALVIAFVVGKLKKDYLANWTLAFCVPAITNLFFIDGITNALVDYTPIFNKRLLTFAFPMIATLGAYILTKNSENKITIKSAQVSKFMAISLAYLYAIFEINNYVNQNSLLSHSMNAMPFVILGFIYALQMKKIGNTNNLAIFEITSYTVSIVALLTLLICGMNYSPIDKFIPILNIRCIAYITAIGASICFARWTKSDFFKYLATILGFSLISFEAFDFIIKVHNYGINYIVSLMWLIYSGTIITIGILKNKSYLKNTGIIISILTLLRIFFHDLEHVDAIYKLIIFIALGSVFMIISYLYNKNQK